MPVSKNRSGNASRTRSRLLPWHIAAVITVTRGLSVICWKIAADAACVNARAELFFICTTSVGPPLELRRRVEQHRIFRRRLEAVALFRDHVQQHRPFDVAHHPQVLAQQADVVPVDRAEVAQAQVLEQHAAVQAGLGRFLELRQEPLDRIAQQRHLAQHLDDFFLEPRVHAVHPQPIEIIGHAAHARADRHLVVVQNDEQPPARRGRRC